MSTPRRALWLLLMLVLALPARAQELPPSLVLVIDDLGMNLARGRRVLALPGPLTCAVLPHTPYARVLADAAQAGGKDLILHTPMANLQALNPGPGALTPELTRSELQGRLRAALDSLPPVQGLNNHQGSLLTQLAEPMNWVMEVARERGLFFIDSRTTAATVAFQRAQAAGVPALERDVFLDHRLEPAAIAAAFERALSIARRDGVAVVIGHPHPQTLSFLEQALPRLGEQGIGQLSASAWLALQRDQRRRQAYDGPLRTLSYH